MRASAFVIASGFALVLAACASPGEESAQSSQDVTSTLETKLRCDDGAAHFDVDAHTTQGTDIATGQSIDFKSVTFTVHDHDIVEYFASKVDHIVGADGQIALRGTMRAELAVPTFDYFEDWSFGTPSTRSEGNQVRVTEQVVGVVHHVHGDGAKVRVVYNHTTQRSTCSTYWEEGHCAYDARAQAAGRVTTSRTDEPIADWVFGCTP